MRYSSQFSSPAILEALTVAFGHLPKNAMIQIVLTLHWNVEVLEPLCNNKRRDPGQKHDMPRTLSEEYLNRHLVSRNTGFQDDSSVSESLTDRKNRDCYNPAVFLAYPHHNRISKQECPAA